MRYGGVMRRRDIPRALVASAVGTTVLPARSEAQACSASCYPQTPAELQAGITPINTNLPPGQVDRYFTNTTPGSTDATSAFVGAIRQAQQLNAERVAIGAPVTVHGLLAIASSVTIPAAAYAGGMLSAAPVSLVIVSGSINVADSKTLQIRGAFSAPRITCFVGAGAVTFGAGACLEAYPEWWGARPDSAPGLKGTIAITGTDCTAAMNAALLACAGGADLKVGLIPLRLATGYYLCGNVTLYPASCVRGMGREVSGVLASSAAGTGATPYWWTDNGSAAKIVLEDFAMYGCYAVATKVNTLCRLGYGPIPFGSEGYIRGMWFRDCASRGGGWALDVQSNVGFFDLISIYGNNLPDQNLLRLGGAGAANMFSNIALLAAGPNCSSFSCDGPATSIAGLEIEAPGSTSTASAAQHTLYLGNNTVVHGLTLSGTDQTIRDAWIAFGPACTTWEITGINFFFGPHGTAVVTGGNARRADGSYFGGLATAVRAWAATVPYVAGSIATHGGYCWICTVAHTASRASEPPNATYWRHYTGGYTPRPWSSTQTYYVGSLVTARNGYNYLGIRGSVGEAPPNPTYWAPYSRQPAPLAGQGNWFSETDGRRLQAFTLRIRNNGAGVLEHQISESTGSVFASVVHGAAATFTTTPTGPDDLATLVAGGKIGSASPDVFWVDTPSQTIADTVGVASVAFNTTGTPLNVVAAIANVALHGASANRLCFRITNAVNGSAFALTPANFGGASGSAMLQIVWTGNLSN
jgi:hypothetical protein